ncbi:MAG: dihydrolipoamide acetyltransferase family protein [Sulfolobales archaeon]
MVTEIRMPKLGLTMTKGVIKEWLKKEGERVEKDEPLFIIETEKITSTVTSPVSGYLLKILARVGSEVPVGQVVAYVGELGESIPGVAPPPTVPAPPAPKVRATPRAKALAQKEGIDLSLVKGTGPEGLITEEDVLRYIRETRAKTKLGLKVKEVIPLTSLRKTIAERMTTSLRDMAQVTLFREESVELVVKLKNELDPIIYRETGLKLTYTPIFIKIVAEALKRFPLVNSTLEDDAIKIIDEINVGFAVAVDHGLIVPVVRNADVKDLKTIVVEVNELIRKAREGKLTLDEVQCGTFTITNLGMYGIDGFTPIINPPQVAILGIGRIVNKPVFIGDKLVSKPMAVFSLTFDHRVIDGHTAAQFLDTIIRIMQSEEDLRKVLTGPSG